MWTSDKSGLEKALALAEPLGIGKDDVAEFAEAHGQAIYLEFKKAVGRIPSGTVGREIFFEVADGHVVEVDEEHYEDSRAGISFEGSRSTAWQRSDPHPVTLGPGLDVTVANRNYSLKSGLRKTSFHWKALSVTYGGDSPVSYMAVSGKESSPSGTESLDLIDFTIVEGFVGTHEPYPALFREGDRREIKDERDLSPDARMILGVGVQLVKGFGVQLAQEASRSEAQT